MASKAIAGVGTVFRRWSGTAWVPIAEINSIAGPSFTRETIDVTSLDSTGGYREFIAGFRDAGTLTLSMNFTRTSFDIMKGDFESNTVRNYQIILPDDDETALDFEGFVTECPLTIPPDDKVTMEVTIKITGEVLVSSGGISSP